MMSAGGSPDETSGASAELAEIAFRGDPFAVGTEDGAATGGFEPVNTWAIRPRMMIPNARATTTNANFTLGPGISRRGAEPEVWLSVAVKLMSGPRRPCFALSCGRGSTRRSVRGALSRAKHTGVTDQAPELSVAKF